MGLCASLLKPKAKKKRYPEPRRGMPKALFVARGDRGRGRGQQQYKPKPAEAPVVFQAHDVPAGRSRRLHEPGNAEKRKCYQGGSGGGGDALAALDYTRFICARMPSGGVEPVTTTMMPGRRKTAATTTDMTPESAPPMTPMRPVWQRRILMGMRCELPRFSGLILYDEHGRPIHIGTPTRRRGKKKITGASTLRDLL